MFISHFDFTGTEGNLETYNNKYYLITARVVSLLQKVPLTKEYKIINMFVCYLATLIVSSDSKIKIINLDEYEN